MIFHNTHEAIVEQGVWDTAKKCRTVKRRTDTMGEANPLTGLIYCYDCGRRMYNHRCNPCEVTDKRTGKKIKKKGADKYCCSLYQIHRNDCTMHHISTESLKELILETIRGATIYARENETEFVKIIREASAIQQGEAVKNHKQLIAKNEKRIAELKPFSKKRMRTSRQGGLPKNGLTNYQAAMKLNRNH